MTPSTQDARATGLVELAVRCEQATGADRSLNREVALAVGWHRYSPSEIGKSNPGWIAPEDFIGEYVGKDGRRTPKLDSLHGTDIWREPRDYLSSLDAAMSLIGKDAFWRLGNDGEGPDVSAFKATVTSGDGPTLAFHDAVAATPALALTAAALRALAASTKDMNHDG